MARKLTGNPQKDYNNGYKAGYIAAGKRCIAIARHLAKLPLYNIIEKYVEDEEKQRQAIIDYAEEDDRLYGEEFWEKPSKVRQALRGVQRIYNETGLDKKGYVIPFEDMEDREDEK